MDTFTPPPGYSTGLIPRNYGKHPSGYLASAPSFPDELLIPESEWASRLAAQQAAKSSLWDLREANYDTLRSLDQNGKGLCWAFSTVKAVMYLRAIMGEPAARLSAWWVAGKIKNWRDEGGWGSASLAHIVSEGVPEESFCPSYRPPTNNEACSENAKKHRVTEWWDGSESREQNRKIMVTCFLLGMPPVLDYNHMSHSMCGCRLVSVNPLVVDCDNSWGEGNNRGLLRLEGSKAIPDGLVIPRVTAAA